MRTFLVEREVYVRFKIRLIPYLYVSQLLFVSLVSSPYIFILHMENLRASALRLVAYPVKHGERTPKKPCFDIIAGITGKWKF